MRERYERFMQTELGQLFRAYDNATINYWKRDADERISFHRLEELNDKARAATNVFVAKLMELAGV